MNQYSTSSYRQQAPAPVMSGLSMMDEDYDYTIPKSPLQPHDESESSPMDGDEALLDLAQLEELHKEAEKMKALGNKHMATQEYTRAYNAYSAALQLSPVGPSSHVFLSNRAAALLSLKRYNAAATDARRAIALAPTFGKAHARLGQALYFLKDYDGAVTAYQDAIHYEPDNQVTQTYLGKAKAKLDKHRRKMAGEEVSVATSMADHYVPSVATNDGYDSMLMGAGGYRGRGSQALVTAAARKQISPTAATTLQSPSNLSVASSSAPMNGMVMRGTGNISLLGSAHKSQYNDPNADPDFEEALRIQQQANKYLAHKQYKNAMEEYTAALFLVPDDLNLSPELHLGRAHALNGSRRHERARNDCLLAIKLKPSPAAYSTLAKSYFYMKDYKASLKAFQDCINLLPPGESLGMFDRAYYEKAEAALDEEEASLANTSPSRGFGGGSSVYTNRTVPKLPPPRFVPRDEAIHAAPNVPSMPTQWPQQSPRSPTNFRCGPERQVLFLSEALGIKLNRGSDGMVRVLSVTPMTPGSPLVRRGEIGTGDVIRECCGVDLRRPITNIMWGDTVALIKMAPRPITFVVAKEVSEVPLIVQEEMRRASAAGSPDNKLSAPRPSNASGDKPVRKVEPEVNRQVILNVARRASPVVDDQEHLATSGDDAITGEDIETAPEPTVTDSTTPDDVADNSAVAECDTTPPDLVPSKSLQLRSLEDRLIAGEILFERSSAPAYFGWDNLRWLSYSGIRNVAFSQHGYRYFEKAKRQLFWSTDASSYEERLLAIYDEPNLIMVLRRPNDEAELVDLLSLDNAADLEERALGCYWIVESVLEPSACILKLSPLTSGFSMPVPDADERRLSCFELRTPVESVIFSSVRVRQDLKESERSFGDSGAFLEASATEMALGKRLCLSRDETKSLGIPGADLAWKHQIIQGTLHSLVVSGNCNSLETAIQHAMTQALADTEGFAHFGKLPSRVIDEQDESGHSPLWYAVVKRMSKAVSLLVKAGASTDFRDPSTGMTLVHLSARQLDDVSLATLLASESPRPNPNALDLLGRTPMYLACTEGNDDAALLERCLTTLQAWGGKIVIRDSLVPVGSPVAFLASQWRSEMLSVVLRHVQSCLPLSRDDERSSSSLAALFEYPIHAAVAGFDMNMLSVKIHDTTGVTSPLVRTLRLLIEHGFEPNERLDVRATVDTDFIGFTPCQILIAMSVRENERVATKDPLVHHRSKLLLRDASLFLVQNGARLVLDTPPLRRPLSSSSQDVLTPSMSDDSAAADETRTCINWTSRNEIMFALGADEEAFKQAWKYWTDLNATAASLTLNLLEDDNIAFPTSSAVGGSDEKSCAVCWKQFGALLNRKHKCRASKRFVCDDCSMKRIIRNGKQYRVSDGQYLRARTDVLQAETERASRKLAAAEPKTAHRTERLDAQEESNRNSLFGGMLDQAAGLIFGGEEQQSGSSSSLGALASSLGETRDALNQRGVRLNQLGDKSADLVDASENFAKMAKELAKQSERGLFW